MSIEETDDTVDLPALIKTTADQVEAAITAAIIDLDNPRDMEQVALSAAVRALGSAMGARSAQWRLSRGAAPFAGELVGAMLEQLMQPLLKAAKEICSDEPATA